MIKRHCRNCGCEFTPAHSGDCFCGESKECDDAARDDEREAEADRRERADADEYKRY